MPIVTSPPDSVPRSFPAPRYENWQQAVRDAIRDPAELCHHLQLPGGIARTAKSSTAGFPLFVPKSFLARMEPGNPDDPLLLQVLPRHEETEPADGQLDPVDDANATLQPGLLQKYAGRVLLVTTGACAVHCRYCFRRHYPYQSAPHGLKHWQPALDQIADDTTLEEVILSGGDPLMLTDGILSQLADRLAAIPHLRRLRIHTRLPIMIPERVSDELLGWLSSLRLTSTVVIHANHAAEIDAQVADVLFQLHKSGAMLLNQAVLLRGVNDSVAAQRALSQRLAEAHILPYYLHQLDRVAGATHFEVPVEQGKQIISALRSELPGYLVPRYVQEIAHKPHKIVLQ